MTAFSTRTLGRSGIEVSPLGLGCWAIGGPWSFNGAPAGWSEVDDTESVRALRRAFELGVTFFDTAANYGAGHSERVLGRAFAGRARRCRHRDQVRLPRRRRDEHRSLLRQQRRRQRRRRPPPRRSRHQPPTTRHRLRRCVPTPRRESHARTRARSPRRPRRSGGSREDPYLRVEHRPSRRDQTVRDIARMRRRPTRAERPGRHQPGDARVVRGARPCEHQPQPTRHGVAHRQVHSRHVLSHQRSTPPGTVAPWLQGRHTNPGLARPTRRDPRTYSPATTAPSPREHSHGSGHAARRPSRSRDSRPLLRSRRTAGHSTRAR